MIACQGNKEGSMVMLGDVESKDSLWVAHKAVQCRQRSLPPQPPTSLHSLWTLFYLPLSSNMRSSEVSEGISSAISCSRSVQPTVVNIIYDKSYILFVHRFYFHYAVITFTLHTRMRPVMPCVNCHTFTFIYTLCCYTQSYSHYRVLYLTYAAL